MDSISVKQTASVLFPQYLRLFPQLLTILRTQLIGTFRTSQGGVGHLPEPVRVDQHAKLPNQENQEGHEKPTEAKEAAGEDQVGEHHQMIPIENAAGGAAAILHNQPERTPDQYTNQITDEE